MLRSARPWKRWRRSAVGPVLAVAVVAAATAPLASGSATAPRERLVVAALPGAEAAARSAVEALGGRIDVELPLVHGFAAEVPSHGLEPLRTHPAVRALSRDDEVRPRDDPGGSAGRPRSVYREVMGAAALADAGATGDGVTVALIDTGVTPGPDLAGRMVEVSDPLSGASPCVDLSGEGHCTDSYGHGTFMAGLIAGDGSASGGRWAGVAPEARILSLKVAGRDGSSDVSKVIAAIQWVVSFKDRYGIDVLNLSLGTDSVQAWDVDPFNYAVERAWEAGIVVTVAASNRGPAAQTISKPGDDPYVITIGAIDDHGTVTTSDDRLPDFSARGPTAHGLSKPDVVAPGAHLVSLRAVGSEIDAQFPTDVDGSYRRGSGTSMATAAVAGGVALLLERHPDWSPDQVKDALRAGARPVASSDVAAIGAGLVDLAAADAGGAATGPRPDGRSSGLGRLDASRGNVLARPITVSDTVDDALLSAGLLLWDPLGFVTGDWTAATWAVSPWATHRWHTTTWHGDDWKGDDWHGDNWHGDNWHGDWSGSERHGQPEADTYGRPWAGAAWYGLWD